MPELYQRAPVLTIQQKLIKTTRFLFKTLVSSKELCLLCIIDIEGKDCTVSKVYIQCLSTVCSLSFKLGL